MMISPEGYYEEHLRHKTADQITTIIRGLKREIGRLKNTIEHPDYAPTICPDESVQLWCTRLYLDRAKEALVEAGGTYTPSQAEQKAAEFEDNIPNISKVIFSIGGFFGGHETRTINLEGEHLRMWVEHSFVLTPSNVESEPDDPMTKEEFLDELRELHIGEWRKNYSPRRFGYIVMDGTQWSLEIHFNNGRRPLKIYGDNAYPYNFNRFREMMGMDPYDMEDEEYDDE